MTDLYPAQTTEYVPQPVLGDGAVVTAGVAYSIVPNGQPAGTWTPATIVNNQTCFLITGMTPGKYRKWAQITAGNETVVLDCGTLTVV